MRAARLLALALLAAAAGGALAAPAKTPAPAPAKVPPDKVKAPPMGDIVFYVAHGDTDACGAGCSEWIAAEGKIVPGAAQRLRRLLAKLGPRRPPIFLHSPGGSVAASIELGRLIHDQKFTVSVGHTIPHDCDRDKPIDKCDAVKRSAPELPSDFELTTAMCNSGCVYVLAAGVTRLVPPWVRLGIHDVGLEPDQKVPSAAALAAGVRTAHARLQDYSRDMGIDKALLTASFAVPFESVKAIDRDEIVRFGIDRREFAEDAWRRTPATPTGISKLFFFRIHSGQQPHYRNGALMLDCGFGSSLRLLLGLAHDSSDHPSAGLPPIGIDMNGHHLDLQQPTSLPNLDFRSIILGAAILHSITDETTISVSGADPENGSAGGIVLKMGAFAGTVAKLRNSCEATGRNFVAPFGAGYPGQQPGWASPFGPMGSKTTGPFPSQFPALPARANPSAQTAMPSPAPKPPQTEFGDRGGKNIRAAAARPARVETVELTRTAAGGDKLRLDTIHPNCANGPMTVSIIQYPQHGALTLENNNQVGVCNPDGALVFYRSSPGYVGADSITLNIEYPSGVDSTRRYSIEVK